MTDVDDFTDYTEACSCGHPRRNHWGGCSGTHKKLDVKALPEPTYVDLSNPFEWPTNWPPVADCPYVEVPCTCSSFGPADPEPPEDWS